jgi:hypothetical protein
MLLRRFQVAGLTPHYEVAFGFVGTGTVGDRLSDENEFVSCELKLVEGNAH